MAENPTLAIPRPGVRAPGRSRVRDWIGHRPGLQAAALVLTLVAVVAVARTTGENLARAGITPGFAFLGHAANFDIGESLIAYAPSDSFGRAILVGFVNTAVVAVAGCVLATILGVALGVARLSSNPLLSGSVRVYVEVIRNTPLLLQLFVWSGFFHALPAPRQAFAPLPGVLLSNRGVFVPALAFADGVAEGAVILALAAAGLLALARLRTPPARRTRRRLLGAGAAILVAAVAALLAARPGLAAIDVPALQGFNIRGGLSLTPEFCALLVGLVVNAAAGIAEIVRAGILSVPRGQWEAARSLGLPGGRIMRLVVLPQALRVIVPVMTSAYLSLTKNSSLAVAIGYPDLVSIVNTTANQTGQALECILVMAVVYLSTSLAVSAFMNWYDARHAVERARA